MTVDTTRYLLDAGDAAGAVHGFFAKHVRVSDPNMSGDTCRPEMHERICDLVAATVADRLGGVNEIITLTFTKVESKYCLVSPDQLAQSIEYRSNGAVVYLKTTSGLAHEADGTYALRASPKLVTCGDMVVWASQPL